MPQVVIRSWTRNDKVMTMALTHPIVAAIFTYCFLLLSGVHPHQISLRDKGFQMNFKDLSIISPSTSVNGGQNSAYIWKTDILQFLMGDGSQEESVVDFDEEYSIPIRHSLDDFSFPPESSLLYEHSPKYLSSHISKMDRRSDASAVNSGSVYQLRMCTGDYLRISSDGIVSTVRSRFDLNTQLSFYQCRGPSAFRIRGVRSQRFLAMNDAAMLVGITESASDPNCSDWNSVWFERLTTFPFPPLDDMTFLTYHVTSPDGGQPWYLGFNRNGRPIPWNLQPSAQMRKICFVKETRS